MKVRHSYLFILVITIMFMAGCSGDGMTDLSDVDLEDAFAEDGSGDIPIGGGFGAPDDEGDDDEGDDDDAGSGRNRPGIARRSRGTGVHDVEAKMPSVITVQDGDYSVEDDMIVVTRKERGTTNVKFETDGAGVDLTINVSASGLSQATGDRLSVSHTDVVEGEYVFEVVAAVGDLGSISQNFTLRVEDKQGLTWSENRGTIKATRFVWYYSANKAECDFLNAQDPKITNTNWVDIINKIRASDTSYDGMCEELLNECRGCDENVKVRLSNGTYPDVTSLCSNLLNQRAMACFTAEDSDLNDILSGDEAHWDKEVDTLEKPVKIEDPESTIQTFEPIKLELENVNVPVTWSISVDRVTMSHQLDGGNPEERTPGEIPNKVRVINGEYLDNPKDGDPGDCTGNICVLLVWGNSHHDVLEDVSVAVLDPTDETKKIAEIKFSKIEFLSRQADMVALNEKLRRSSSVPSNVGVDPEVTHLIVRTVTGRHVYAHSHSTHEFKACRTKNSDEDFETCLGFEYGDTDDKFSKGDVVEMEVRLEHGFEGLDLGAFADGVVHKSDLKYFQMEQTRDGKDGEWLMQAIEIAYKVEGSDDEHVLYRNPCANRFISTEGEGKPSRFGPDDTAICMIHGVGEYGYKHNLVEFVSTDDNDFAGDIDRYIQKYLADDSVALCDQSGSRAGCLVWYEDDEMLALRSHNRGSNGYGRETTGDWFFDKDMVDVFSVVTRKEFSAHADIMVYRPGQTDFIEDGACSRIYAGTVTLEEDDTFKMPAIGENCSDMKDYKDSKFQY